MKDFLSTLLFGNSIERWLIALGIALLVFFGLLLIRRVIRTKLQKIATKNKLKIDDFLANLISSVKIWFFVFIALAVGLLFINLPESWNNSIKIALTIGFSLQIASWANASTDFFVRQQIGKAANGSKATIYNAARIFAKILIWVFAILVIMDSIPGVDVTSLVAGLGIGGIAIGLGVQSILEDLFASVSITVDQPFVIGDFIEVNGKTGIVEHIGIKSTRLRALTGEQIVMGNAAITSNEIRNFQKLEQRRVSITVGVAYETPYEKLEKIPVMIKAIVNTLDSVRFDRVHFDSMESSSLDFLLVYYVESSDYLVHMNVKQTINFAIIKQFGEAGIEIAYPTQTLYIPKTH